MRYVKRYRDAHGVERLYFRKVGHPRNGEALISPWPVQPEGSELEAEVQDILGPEGRKAKPSNLAGATRTYELGADFTVLSASTKYIYRLLLKDFDATLGDLPVAAFTPAFILSLRDAWAARGHRAANLRLQVLKNVLNPQLIAQDLPDPFSRIKQVRRPRDRTEPHPVWSEAVVRIVIEEAIEAKKYGLARAVAVGRYVGARRGDIVRLKHSARSNGRVVFLSGKRRIQVDMPEDPILTEWLTITPASQPPSKWQSHVERKTKVTRMPPTTLVFNISNLPYSEDGLGQELAKLIVKLHDEGRIDSDAYDLHGLRHTFGVEAALAGCTDAQGAALMGHGSPNSFATYRRQASRLRMSDDAAALISALRERAAGTGPERDVSKGVSRSV
jgi:integrase